MASIAKISTSKVRGSTFDRSSYSPRNAGYKAADTLASGVQNAANAVSSTGKARMDKLYKARKTVNSGATVKRNAVKKSIGGHAGVASAYRSARSGSTSRGAYAGARNMPSKSGR